MFTQPFHVHDSHNAILSEGGALAVVGGDFHETPHQTGDNTDFPRLMQQSEARLRLACPPLARCGGAPHGRGAGGESDPTFFVAGAPSERVSRFTSHFTVNPLLGGVALTTLIPGGKAIEPANRPAGGTAKPTQRTSRPQLTHWPRPAPGGPWALPSMSGARNLAVASWPTVSCRVDS